MSNDSCSSSMIYQYAKESLKAFLVILHAMYLCTFIGEVMNALV